MIDFEFEAYQMDMLPEEGTWVENNRHYIGKLYVPAENINDLDDKKILKAMSEFKVGTLFGADTYAVSTTDRRRVYAEDLYGDGTWWEVGRVHFHKPVYGLRLTGSEIIR